MHSHAGKKLYAAQVRHDIRWLQGKQVYIALTCQIRPDFACAHCTTQKTMFLQCGCTQCKVRLWLGKQHRDSKIVEVTFFTASNNILTKASPFLPQDLQEAACEQAASSPPHRLTWLWHPLCPSDAPCMLQCTFWCGAHTPAEADCWSPYTTAKQQSFNQSAVGTCFGLVQEWRFCCGALNAR